MAKKEYTGPTNAERGQWADKAVTAFAAEVNMVGEDKDTIISDLLADLMHLCRGEEIDWSVCIRRATDHFDEEVWEEKRDGGVERA